MSIVFTMFSPKVNQKLLVLLNLYFYFSLNSCNSVQNNTFAAPQLRAGGWTPIPTNAKNFKQSESQVSSAKQQPNVEQKKAQDSEMLPIPVIKPHRHGATLGFDLPEQGLTLYLDINELATKPLAQNIGLKVVSHEPQQAQSAQSQTQALNHVKPTHNQQSRQNTGSPINNSNNNKVYNGDASPLHQFVSKMQALNTNGPPKSPITVAKIQKRVKAVRNIGSYEGNAPAPSPAANIKSPAAVLSGQQQKPVNKYHVGYMRPLDLQKALQHVGRNHQPSGNQVHQVQQQMINNNLNTNHNLNSNNNLNSNHNFNSNANSGQRTVIINTHSLNNNNNNLNYDKLFNSPQSEQKKNSPLDSFAPNPDKYFSKPLSSFSQDIQTNTLRPQQQHSASPPASYSYSTLQMPIRPSVQYPVQEKESDRPVVQQTTQEEEQDFDNEVVKRTTTERPVLPPQREDEQQKGFDDDIEPTTQSVDGNRYEEPQRQIGSSEMNEEQQIDIERYKGTTPSMPMQSTAAQMKPSVDDTIVRPFPGEEPPQRMPSQQQQDLMGDLHSCPSVPSTCQQSCDARTDNLVTDASNIREIIQKLNADSLITTFPTLEQDLQNVIDFASSDGYTIILPSNEAMARLPPNLFEFWKKNVNSLGPLLDNHVIDSAQSLEDMRVSQIIQPRSGGKVRVQRAHNDSYTMNGERVTVANQVGPAGGMIHVIDGILYPNSDKDIMETLKTCNRLDGFVTLAEGTAFADTLKQSGPFTVFVPSNEALQKVPDNDLDIIRNNMTALREFLKYHVAHGAHYSHDLKDGQFIPSMIDGQYIQVGVRVDGCRRRLVEANVSPLYRADIPAANGVIHVVDWVLKPTDRDWCENVILPR